MKLSMRFLIAAIVAIILLLIVGDSIGICGKLGLIGTCGFVAYFSQEVSNFIFDSKNGKKRGSVKKGEKR